MLSPRAAHVSRSQVSTYVSLPAQPSAVVGLIDELAAARNRLSAGAATKSSLAVGPITKIVIAHRSDRCEQIFKLCTELPVRKVSCQGHPL